MDISESGQKDGLSDSSSEIDPGQDGRGDKNPGGSTETTSSEQPVKNEWVRDHNISFKKMIPLFLNLKDVLEQTISVERGRLNSLITTKNSFRR